MIDGLALSAAGVEYRLLNLIAAGIALSYNVYGWQRNRMSRGHSRRGRILRSNSNAVRFKDTSEKQEV